MLKKATAHRQVYKRLSTTSLSDRGRFGENSRLAYCRRMMASTRNAKIIEKILSITYLVLSK